MRIRVTCEIARTPEIVFPWLAEPEKAMVWQKNVKGGAIIDKKPEMTGTTFTEVLEENGRTLEMRGTITGYSENRFIGFQLRSRIHEVAVSYTLEARQEASGVTIEANIKWKFPLNIISLVIGRKIKNGIAEQLESEIFDLKRMCEAG
jgi:hypothetical protein